jgi:hypothetical protein
MDFRILGCDLDEILTTRYGFLIVVQDAGMAGKDGYLS